MKNFFLRISAACATLFHKEEPTAKAEWGFENLKDGADDLERWQFCLEQLAWCDRPDTVAFFKSVALDKERLVAELEGLDLDAPGFQQRQVKITARLQNLSKLLSYKQHMTRMCELYKKKYPTIQ